MNNNLSGFKNVSEYYLFESQKIVDMFEQPIIFKTDLWNEERLEPKSGGIIGNLKNIRGAFALEYNPDRVSKAKSLFPDLTNNFMQGDIRSLPYEEDKFEVILDLSTIDHVLPDEMPSVISGYAKVIKHSGLLLLISWCDPNFRREVITNYSPTTQYYHSLEDLKIELNKYFEILENFIR